MAKHGLYKIHEKHQESFTLILCRTCFTCNELQRIKHLINDVVVFTYTKPQIGGSVDFNKALWKSKEGSPLKKGYISLQSESHPVAFKNIEILELH